MTTASTTLLGLALPVTGELSGTWGDVVNASLTNLLDTAIAGTTTLSSDADVTLTTTTLSSNQARQAVILWTAGGTATRTITAPAQSKSYVIINATSSSQSIKLVGVGPTTGITIVAGEKCFAAWNGSDFVKVGNTSGAGVFSTVTASSLTSGRVTYAGTAGLLQDSANLTFNGTTLTANTIGAFTLGGTVAGGGNQINNVIIGTTGAAAGNFTTLGASSLITQGTASGQNGVFGIVTGAGGANSGVAVVTGATGTGYLGFNNANNASIPGQLTYNHSTNTMNLYSSGPITFQPSGGTASTLSSTGLAVTGTLTSTLDATIYGLTVGRGGGAVSTNTAVGASALAGANTGVDNHAFGYQALLTNTTGSFSTAFGSGSLKVSNANQNAAFGHNTLFGNTSGANNTAIGSLALNANTTASNNTAVGKSSLPANTTGASNTAVGTEALQANTTASNNTAVGFQAGYTNTTGTNNVAFGKDALRLNNTTSNNTAVGTGAGKANTGSENTFIGSDAGETTTTGTFNTFLGRLSGSSVTSGGKNTIIGSYTGSAAPISATGSNYIVLSDGDGNPRGIFDSSGNLLVGTTSGTADKATFAAATTTTNVLAMVSTDDSSGGLFAVFRNSAYTSIGNIARVTTTNAVVYNTTSDYRLKTVIRAVTGAGERIDALKPIDYHWIDGGEQARGFLAHEFQEVYANSVTGEKDAVDDNGKPIHQAMQASTPEVIADLVAELQSLRKRITALEAK